MARGIHHLDGYFTRLARAFSRDHGVQVIVRGNEKPRAELTRRRIYLPATADYATGEGREALEGLLDHEAAHIEQEALAEAAGRPGYVATLDRCRHGRERLWLNVFEDVRIEELWASRWPGVAKNLEAKARHSFRTAGEFYRTGRADPHWALACGVIARARGHAALCDWLPAEAEAILARLQPEIEDARHQQGPADALDLARRTLAKIVDIADGGDPAADAADTGDGAGEEDAPDWGASDADAPAAAAEGEPGEAEGEAAPSGSGEGPADPDDGEGVPLPTLDANVRRMADQLTTTMPRCEDPQAETAKALKLDADKAAMGDPRRVIAHPIAAAGDRVIVPPPDVSGYATAAAVALPAVNAMATRLAIWLRARADRLVPDQLSGQIDGSALSALVTGGDRRIFQHVEKGPDLRTAVAVLVDESGSMMFGDRYLRAREAAVAIGWTLQRCGAAFEILGWTDTYAGLSPGAMEGIYTRIEAQQIYAYKAFPDHFPRVCKRLGSIYFRANNDDSSALLTVARRLLARPEPRKILLVLSDGAPEHDGYCPDVQLHHVIAQVRAAGIEIGAIGISSDYVCEFYAPHVAVVHRPADLAVRVVELFKSLCQTPPRGARHAA